MATPLPAFMLPQLVNLLSELGFVYHDTKVYVNVYPYEQVEFRHEDDTLVVVERYMYSDTRRCIKLLMGKANKPISEVELVPGAYPQQFDLDTVKTLLTKMGIDVVSRLRDKRLTALLS